MANHGSATVREHTPHANQRHGNQTSQANQHTQHANPTTRTASVINALKRRAQAVLNDDSIDSESRAIIRYALETNDPWLAKLVRRADAGEQIVDADGSIVHALDFAETPETNTDDSDEQRMDEERIEALTDLICRAGDETGTRTAALLVLMTRIENSAHPKALANAVKHRTFTCCAEMNLYGIVDAQVETIERELFADSHLSLADSDPLFADSHLS